MSLKKKSIKCPNCGEHVFEVAKTGKYTLWLTCQACNMILGLPLSRSTADERN